MARIGLVFVVGIALVSAGCLRRSYDLCAEDPPNVECFDAATHADSASGDAAARDDAGDDDARASENDAGPDTGS